METVILPHLPQHPLQIGLFTDVENAAFLRSQLLEGNTSFEYAFLDVSTILSRTHLHAACFRAINDLLHDRLKSRNVHSEIVFSLSPNNNVHIQPVAFPCPLYPTLISYKIAESFRRFGIADSSKVILAIKVSQDANQVSQHLQQHVKGTVVPLTDATLAKTRDVAKLRKYYKLEIPKKGEQDQGLSNEAEVFVLASMALKGS